MINKYKKVAFVRVDEDVSLARSSEFMRICLNMNSIVQTTGGGASYLNGKSESHNNTLANITRALLLNSSHKEKTFLIDYQYAIWLSHRTENIFHGDVSYFLWHGTRPPYKHIKIWGLRVYIINGSATRKKLDYISHRDYFVGYVATKRVTL